MQSTEHTRIVIVGGGAGGLELATKLGHKLGKHEKASVTLVDRSRTHIWKPLLHEVATGTLDTEIDGVVYQAHAAKHYFKFQYGSMCSLDREQKRITLAAIPDEKGIVALPERYVDYDILVIAIGSISNDFGTPGVADNCYMLDSQEQAQRFQRHLLTHFIQAAQNNASAENTGKPAFKVAIVGAGATGVELSAELQHIHELLPVYIKDADINTEISIDLIEAGPRILPALPERISTAAAKELEKLNVTIHTDTRITQVTETAFIDADSTPIEANLKVWAAGVKVPSWVTKLGLETNNINQIICEPTLASSSDQDIYAIGDCCHILSNGEKVPPRAQSAHQMASLVAQNIVLRLKQKEERPFKYRDYGSLINLSRFSTVGSLMGNLMKGSLFIEGLFARTMYLALYRMHQLAIYGYIKGPFIIILGKISKSIRPKMKLH